MTISPLTRNPPVLPYSGVTIIISHASRFDTVALLSSTAGAVVDSALKSCGSSRYGCDIRTLGCSIPFLPGTKVVLLAGRDSMKRFVGMRVTDNVTLDEIRGYPIPVGDMVFIPTYYPQDCVDRQNFEASLNPLSSDYGHDDDASETGEDESATKAHGKTRRVNWKFWLQRDITKCIRIAREGFRINQCEYILSPPLAQAIEALESWQGKFFFDIETNPATSQLVCFSFGNSSKVFACPILDQNKQLYYTLTGTARLLRALCSAFERCGVVIHNAQFDLYILLRHYGIPPPAQDFIEDTMLMHHRCFPEVEKSLGHLIALHTNQPYHKNTAGTFTPHNYEQLRSLLLYNAKDVETLALCYAGIRTHAAKDVGTINSCRQANASIRPYLLLSYRGLRLANTELCDHIDVTRKKCTWLEERILPKLIGHDLNPRSHVQVGKYLYEELDIKKPTKDFTAEKTLLRILLKQEVPALKLIIALRGLSREASDLAFTQTVDNRATCTYKISGTDTLRLSSSSLLDGTGRNMQNWSKRIRRLIIPDAENIFVQCDQAGAEALIVAYLCKPQMYRELFIHGVKPHTFVALQLFYKQLQPHTIVPLTQFLALSPAQLKQHSNWREVAKLIASTDSWSAKERYYFIAKMVCHASNYGMKGPTFCMNVLEKSEGQVNLSISDATKFLALYHGLFPEIQEWHGRVKNELINSGGVLRNLFSFPRLFSGGSFHDDMILKKAYAFVPQSTVGTITNVAISEIQAKLDAGAYTGFCVMQNGHDSILAQCAQRNAQYTARELCSALNQKFVSPYDGVEFSMRSEASVGMDWKNTKEIPASTTTQ